MSFVERIEIEFGRFVLAKIPIERVRLKQNPKRTLKMGANRKARSAPTGFMI
jgi:hypothetical protein